MRRALYGVGVLGMVALGLRLMPAYLASDGLALPARWEFWVFALAGSITAIVLTGGNAMLAHKLAKQHRSRGLLWWCLLAFWVMYLAGAVELAAPYIVRGIAAGELARVLTTPLSQWIWAVTSILIVEGMIAGVMAASVLDEQPEQRKPSKPGRLSRLADAATASLEAKLEASADIRQSATAQAPVYATADPPAVARAGRPGIASNAAAAEQGKATAESYACPYCDYAGTSHQGLNAHKRFCDGWQNGRRDEPVEVA